ncbi:MAG: hypothetical protein HYZ54_02365 [Ignavibacteriae bacterium]|nr:hypothetical protein [Ignavibacteriota bacterium]
MSKDDTKITDLAGVKEWLKTLQPNDSVVVTKDMFDATFVNQLFSTLGQSSISLTNISIDQDDTVLSGLATLLGNDGTTVKLVFTEPDKDLILEMDFQLASDVQWKLIDSFDLAFTQLGGSVTINTELKVLSLSFSTTIEAGAAKYQIPVTLQIPSFKGDWILSGSFDGLGSLSQEVVSAMAGNNDILSILPADLINFSYLQLKEFQMSFNPSEKTCSFIKVYIAYANPDGWKIFSDQFLFTGIELDFDIFNPKNTLPTSYQAKLIGNFSVAGVPIEVGGLFPDKAIFAQLQPEAEMNITHVLETFGVPLPSGFPEINISTLNFVMYIDDKSFEFEIAITDQVIIYDQLALDNFYFQIQVDASGSKLAANGVLNTQFSIGETTMALAGNYDSDGVSTLYGEVDNLNISALLNDLATKFGITDMPDFIKTEIVLNKTTVLYSTDKTFKFYCEAATQISGNDVTCYVNISATNDGSGYTKELTGGVIVNDQYFEIDFTSSPTENILMASWQDKGEGSKGLNLADIASVFGNEDLVNLLKEIPEDVDLALTSVSFTYSFTDSELVLTAVSQNFGNVVFVASKIDTVWVYALMVGVKEIDLTKLPLIGEEVGALGKFSIDDLKILISSGVISQDNIKKINILIAAAAKKIGKTLPTLPDKKEGLVKCVDLSMTFNAPAGISVPVELSMGKTTTQSAYMLQASGNDFMTTSLTTTTATTNSKVATDNATWINIQKAIGPVYMDKVGLSYQSGTLGVLFSFSLKLGALTITLDGLMVGSPLSKFSPVFDLSGLGITFNTGPVAISGGFIKTESDTGPMYNGQALIKAGSFALSAMGSYAKVNGETSLFIFAMMTNPPLGGPPYFFVTGAAAGFGYNRGLKLPNIDGVPSFPLTTGFVPGQKSLFSDGEDPNKALSVLVSQNIVPVQIGQNWLAAGVQFTSFEMLKSYALVVVEFGTTLEIALLGMTTASVPTGDPNPLLFAQLALDVKILPDDGLISVEAKLASSSYLLDKSCHLTGGFAMYIWFGNNENAGDFVVTLGGYHPSFKPPTYYPKVPLLGFNWVVSSELTIKGGMYFALTPTCLMAGGSLAATWQSGNLKAWFIIGADFLISWKPYHYEAHLYLSFGVSYTFNIDLLFTTISKTISVSLGADLSIWGPSFSGTASIHLWIISFTVDFGDASSQKPKPINWSDFEQSFFPNTPPATQSVQGTNRSVFASRRSKQMLRNDIGAVNKNVSTSKVLNGLVKNLLPVPETTILE